MADPQRRDLTDTGSLRALAHPLRQRMLSWLQRHGSATSADLAAQFGADRGATSYHLRQLARYGFIERDEDRSAGRRRYWRAVRSDLRLAEPDRLDEDGRRATDEIERIWRRDALAALARFESARQADPDAFGAFGPAAMFSISGSWLTADELARFAEEYVALLNRWHRAPEDATPGSRHVTRLMMAFPTPDEP